MTVNIRIDYWLVNCKFDHAGFPLVHVHHESQLDRSTESYSESAVLDCSTSVAPWLQTICIRPPSKLLSSVAFGGFEAAAHCAKSESVSMLSLHRSCVRLAPRGIRATSKLSVFLISLLGPTGLACMGISHFAGSLVYRCSESTEPGGSKCPRYCLAACKGMMRLWARIFQGWLFVHWKYSSDRIDYHITPYRFSARKILYQLHRSYHSHRIRQGHALLPAICLSRGGPAITKSKCAHDWSRAARTPLRCYSQTLPSNPARYK